MKRHHSCLADRAIDGKNEFFSSAVRRANGKSRLAASLNRERKANADLSAANAKVQARNDLAVEAVKTFHTGVSEDILLEEKFKDCATAAEVGGGLLREAQGGSWASRHPSRVYRT